MMSQKHDLERAAVFVNSLPDDARRQVLAELTEREVASVAMATSLLPDIHPHDQQLVARDFFRCRTRRVDATHERCPTPHLPPECGSQADITATGEPANALADILALERPQTTALLLMHLPLDRAVEVLATLPTALQRTVVRRLVVTQPVADGILQDVAEGLGFSLARKLIPARSPNGVLRLARMLHLADPDSRNAILDHLSHDDPPVTHYLKQVLSVVPNLGTARD